MLISRCDSLNFVAPYARVFCVVAPLCTFLIIICSFVARARHCCQSQCRVPIVTVTLENGMEILEAMESITVLLALFGSVWFFVSPRCLDWRFGANLR